MVDRRGFLGALGLGALAAQLPNGGGTSPAVESPEPVALPPNEPRDPEMLFADPVRYCGEVVEVTAMGDTCRRYIRV